MVRGATDFNVAELTDEDTAWNLRIHPRFNFWNHYSIVNSTSYKKPAATSTIRTQSYNNNMGNSRAIIYANAASSDFVKIGDPQQGGSPNETLDEDINQLKYEGGYRLFDPILIKFKAALSRGKIEEIIYAHRNALPGRNYGYISVTNPDGEIKQGWISKMSYNAIDEIASFEIIQKADLYDLS